MTNIILDVDTGIDDALAIMLAVAHPGLSVRAITCVGGNVGVDQVVENTLGILNLMGERNIPVAAGMSMPLLEVPQDASYVHGANGIAGVALPPHGLEPSEYHAVELLRRSIQDSAERVTIVALAPMTNLAVLLRMHPEVASSIERIVFMGGAVGTGNATAAAEFNVWHDPEAASIVLRSGVPMTMYGLEPFYRVTVSEERITELLDGASEVSVVTGALLRHLSGVTATEERIPPGAAGIGDAGAVCAVIDPEGVTTRRAPVHVTLEGTAARGQTIVDFRTGLGAGGESTGSASGIDVVLDVDADRYLDIFLDTVISRG